MEAIVFAANPITWKSQDPVWVEQWPLPKEKLLAAKTLVFEQLGRLAQLFLSVICLILLMDHSPYGAFGRSLCHRG